MNLLFYSARFLAPKIRLSKSVYARRYRNNNRAEYTRETAFRFMLYFRYFGEDVFQHYVNNCRRVSEPIRAWIRSFLSVHGRNWLEHAYTSSVNMNYFIAFFTEASGSQNTAAQTINYSFSWADTPEGADFWTRHNDSCCRFFAVLEHGRTHGDSSLITSPLVAIDDEILPLLLSDRVLRDRLVIPSPASTDSSNTTIVNNNYDPNSTHEELPVEEDITSGATPDGYPGHPFVRISQEELDRMFAQMSTYATTSSH